jgi:hypothetical protein
MAGSTFGRGRSWAGLQESTVATSERQTREGGLPPGEKPSVEMGLPDGDAARFFVNARAGTTRKEGEKYINLFMGIRNIYYVGNEMDIIYTYYLSLLRTCYHHGP